MLGTRIRDLRKEKNLTMSELANMVGVTQGHLSQVERDIIEPSLSLIRKIAEALGVPIVSLFAEDNNDGIVCITPENRKIVKFKNEDIVYEFLTPTVRNSHITPKMEMILSKIGPKRWGSEDVMLHAADECTYVLVGTVEYHINNKVYVLEKNSSIYLPENTPHRIYNPTNETSLVLGVITPPVY